MGDNKEKYGLICSLGGNCAAAMQLRQRHLQIESLPFDWLFHIDTTQFNALANGFQTDFKNWIKLDGMKELPDDEKGKSKDFQYKDTLTNFRYIHDFKKAIDGKNEYKKFHDKYQRRFKRLLSKINSSDRIMFLSSNHYKTDLASVKKFMETLQKKWPHKKFNIVIMQFRAEKDETLQEESITIYKYIRDLNDYDFNFERTNYEWSFLDKLALQEKLIQEPKDIAYFSRKKKRLKIFIFHKLRKSVFTFSFSIFGFGLELYIGKRKDMSI